MKKNILYLSLFLVAAFAFTPAVFADNAPARWVVIPEAIWAPATGGGTWVTDLQVHAPTSGTVIYIQFFYGTAIRTVILTTSTDVRQTFRYSNILQTMGTIDTAFDYSGRVGALLVYTTTGYTVWAQAMTTNGNYGKTIPSLVWKNTANTAAVGRSMVIPGTMNTATYRTFAGFWNSTTTAMTVRFQMINSENGFIGSIIEKTIPAYGFLAFNPFTEAGIPTGYSNTWLYIVPQSGGAAGEGLFCFGSIANNISNDTYALTAIPFQ
jgi:hypothetical protein